MTNTKRTQKEIYQAIIDLVMERAERYLSPEEEQNCKEIVEFCENKIVQLDARTGKPSKADAEKKAQNAILKEQIYTALAENGKGMTATMLVQMGLVTSPQKAVPQLKALAEEGRITNYKEGRSSMWRVAE